VTVFLQAGAVRSQAPVAAPPVAVPGPAGANPSDVDIRLRQRSTLGPEDMVRQAQEYRAGMDSLLKQLATAAEQARNSKDVIRLNCLLDKQAQLKANLAVADNALSALRDNVARRDEGGSVHEYTRITIIHQKAQVLAAEGQACVGEDLAYVGATRVDVDVSGVPSGDFTQPSPPLRPALAPGITRPPPASPQL